MIQFVTTLPDHSQKWCVLEATSKKDEVKHNQKFTNSHTCGATCHENRNDFVRRYFVIFVHWFNRNLCDWFCQAIYWHLGWLIFGCRRTLQSSVLELSNTDSKAAGKASWRGSLLHVFGTLSAGDIWSTFAYSFLGGMKL